MVLFGETPVLPCNQTPYDKNHIFRAVNEHAMRVCQAMCEYGMKKFQDALSILTDVGFLLAKWRHEDLARAFDPKLSYRGERMEFVSQ